MKTYDCLVYVRGFAALSKFFAVPLVLLFVSAIASAQAPGETRGWGYGFIAVGGTAGDGTVVNLTYGGGGERLIYRGFGLGAELGNVTPISNFGNGPGIFSTNASYNFGVRDRTFTECGWASRFVNQRLIRE